MSKKFEIGEELENALYPLEAKLKKETTLSVFTKEEQNILFATYKEINGRTPSKNCTGCFKTMQKSILNWLALYPEPFDMTKNKFGYDVSGVKEIEEFKEEVKEPIKKTRKPRKKKVTKK